MSKIQRALISVSDKAGVVDLARELVKFGVEIISTGGTAALLKKEGIPSEPITEASQEFEEKKKEICEEFSE